MSKNGSSLSRKKFDENNSTPTSRKRLRGQNTSVGIKLIELTEPSDTSHYLKIALNKLFYTHLYFIYLCGTKSFVLKTELYFTFFSFGLGWLSVSVQRFCVSDPH